MKKINRHQLKVFFITTLTAASYFVSSFSVTPAYADNITAKTNPGTQADAGAGGSVAWTNPANVATSNDVWATVALGASQMSNYINVTNFGFAIPANANINYINIYVEGKSSASAIGIMPCIIIGGTRKCASYSQGSPSINVGSDTINQFGFTNTWQNYGHPAIPVTAAQVNASTFGFAFQVQNLSGGANTVSLDNIQVEVDYTAQTVPSIFTNTINSYRDTDAILSGAAKPNAILTNGYFRWGTSNVACSSLPNVTGNINLGTGEGYGDSYQNYGTQITGLSANTTYYYCAVAANSSGTSYGNVVSFTTTGGSNLYLSTTANVAGTATADSANCPSAAGWVNPTNTTASDSAYTTTSPTYPSPNCGLTGDLILSNFGFNVPAGATITGIAVDLGAKYNAGLDTMNTRIYQNISAQSGVWGQKFIPVMKSENYNTAGGPSDMWSGAWTPSIVNNSAFGIRFQSNYLANGIYSINNVRITIYYSNTPIIGSPTATNITGSSALLGANITAQGGSPVTDRGICYAITQTNANPQSGGTGVTCTSQGSGGTGIFTQTISGLTQNSSYSFSAYATNTQGTAYAPVGIFSTLNVNPTGVDTNAPTGINSYYVTLSGVANPNSSASTGHFRVYYSNPGNCNSDSPGANIRYPQSPANDVVIGADTSPHTFTYTIPPSANTFLDPNTQYWYCSFAINTYGTTGGATVATFKTADGPASPCDPPTTGNLTVPSSATCNLNGNFNGVDTGTGTTNNASLVLSPNSSMTIGPTQQIAFGSFQLQKPQSSLTIARGGALKKGGVFVHDKDGDGILDDQIQYIGSTTSAANEFVRRNTMSTNYNYAWKIASSGASLDCNPNSRYAYRLLPNLVRDNDNDGYKTSAASSWQCVGSAGVINGRTYYNDGSGPD